MKVRTKFGLYDGERSQRYWVCLLGCVGMVGWNLTSRLFCDLAGDGNGLVLMAAGGELRVV